MVECTMKKSVCNNVIACYKRSFYTVFRGLSKRCLVCIPLLFVFLYQFVGVWVTERTCLFEVKQTFVFLSLVALGGTEEGLSLGSLIVDYYCAVGICDGIVIHTQSQFQGSPLAVVLWSVRLHVDGL